MNINGLKRSKFCILMALFLLCAVMVTSCKGNLGNEEPSETDTEGTGSVTEDPDRFLLAANGKAQCRIVLSKNCSERLERAAIDLQTKLRQLAGTVFFMDYAEDLGTDNLASGKRIVIGNCGHDSANTVLSQLKYKDYAVSLQDGNIVLASYDDSYSVKAVQYFSDYLSEEAIACEEGNIFLKWEKNYTHANASYRPKTLTVNGTDLSEYAIVYPAGNDTALGIAEELVSIIGSRSGYVLPIRADSEPEQACEILIGKTERSASAQYYQAADAPDLMQYRVLVQNGKILFAGGGLFSTLQAVRSLEGYLTTSNGVLDHIDIRENDMIGNLSPRDDADLRFMSYNILAEFEGWGSSGKIPSDVNLRKEIVASLILGYQPDVIAFSEFFDTWRANLPELISQDYAFVCADRADGVSNRSPLAYNKNRVKVVDSGYCELEQTLTQNRRTITWAVFEDLHTGKRFAVLGTHLESLPELESVRLEQAVKVAELAKEIGMTYQVPTVVMGDFNSLTESAPYNAFVSTSGLYHVQDASEYAVDHIFYSSEFVLQKSGCEENNYTEYASDHKPLYADLRLAGRS